MTISIVSSTDCKLYTWAVCCENTHHCTTCSVHTHIIQSFYKWIMKSLNWNRKLNWSNLLKLRTDVFIELFFVTLPVITSFKSYKCYKIIWACTLYSVHLFIVHDYRLYWTISFWGYITLVLFQIVLNIGFFSKNMFTQNSKSDLNYYLKYFKIFIF